MTPNLEMELAVSYPSEDFVETSYRLVAVGFGLIVAVMVLVFAIFCGRGGPDGQPDLCGKTITIREIESQYRTTWAPSSFRPKRSEHNDAKGSPVYRVVWVFLIVWLVMVGIFFVIAGADERIEVYRVDAQVTGAICVSVALVLCGVWIGVFRTGSLTAAEKDRCKAYEKEFRQNAKVAKDERALEVNEWYDCDDSSKKFWLECATGILVVAWLLCLFASARVQAWTLPGEQYGMLLFVAPGYGLLTGWLLYAAACNFGIAYCARSCPETVKPAPRDANAYAYRGSIWPIVVAFVLAFCAVAIPDPAQPFPFLVAVFFFVPWYGQNLAACAIALLGLLVGVWNVYRLRQE